MAQLETCVLKTSGDLAGGFVWTVGGGQDIESWKGARRAFPHKLLGQTAVLVFPVAGGLGMK